MGKKGREGGLYSRRSSNKLQARLLSSATVARTSSVGFGSRTFGLHRRALVAPTAGYPAHAIPNKSNQTHLDKLHTLQTDTRHCSRGLSVGFTPAFGWASFHVLAGGSSDTSRCPLTCPPRPSSTAHLQHIQHGECDASQQDNMEGSESRWGTPGHVRHLHDSVPTTWSFDVLQLRLSSARAGQLEVPASFTPHVKRTTCSHPRPTSSAPPRPPPPLPAPRTRSRAPTVPTPSGAYRDC